MYTVIVGTSQLHFQIVVIVHTLIVLLIRGRYDLNV